MARAAGKPKWIWIAAECAGEDFYMRARRAFTLDFAPAAARLRVTAFSEYVLYVNGRHVGCGPAPSAPDEPLLDVYTEADLGLVRGRNVIAVLAHNLHVGTAQGARTAGGLWLELAAASTRGRTETIVTDRRWRAAEAEDFSRRAPRLCWTAGFAEIRDLRREPAGWTAAGFDDRRWAPADEVRRAPCFRLGKHAPRGAAAMLSGRRESTAPPRVRERAWPRLAEALVRPRAVAGAGRVRWPGGLTAIPLELAAPNARHGEFYAATFVYSRRRQKARLAFDCDESAAVYVNNRQALRQGYREDFLVWLQPGEQDEYAGVHRGQGRRTEAAEVALDEGWNSVGVVIYDPGRSWGFAVRLAHPRTGAGLPVEFSPDQKTGGLADWHVVLDQLCPCGDGSIPDTPRPNSRTFPDPACQLAWEVRTPSRRAARGAGSLCEGGGGQATARPAGPAGQGGRLGRGEVEGEGRLVLKDGEFVIYDFADEIVGRAELDVEGPAGAFLDLAWADGLDDGCNLAPLHRGMRRADRLILAGGRQTVRLVGRRALRYLALVARSDGGTLTVHRLGVRGTSRLSAPPPVPQTDDADLAAAMRLAARTVRACVQDTLEGSPGRDAEQSIPAAYFLGQAARVLLGRADLEAAALRAFAAEQGDDGFFRGVVPGGVQYVVPDWNLLWVIWLADCVAWTGEKALAADLYPAAERCLDWSASFRDAHGLLENKPDRAPWWLMLDYSPIHKQGVVTAWQALYVRALRAAADVAEFLGNHEAAGQGRAEADAVAAAARERLWSASKGLFVDCRLYERKSTRASAETNYYALYGGLASQEQAGRILSAFWRGPPSAIGGPREAADAAPWGPHETPYVKFFAAEALLERGQGEQALALVRRYFGGMARAGLATVPEVFPLPGPREAAGAGASSTRAAAGDGGGDGPHGGLPPAVLCHGWGAWPPAMAVRWMLGVQPERPGFDALRLSPMPAGLDGLSGRAWTPRGFVEVSIRRRGGRHEIRAALPEGMPYRLDRRHLAKDDVVEVVGGRRAE
ncbi:MAG: hypothetical protein FJ288_06150 [Planctomycetes bacterium]|nr:hypothetical protein [Planctomycetota bacterium]